MTGSAKVYLEKSEVGGQTKLMVTVTKMEEFLENKIIKLPYPVISQSDQNSTVPSTKYKDLKRINHVYTVEGFITLQSSLDGDSALDYYDSLIRVKGAKDKLTAAQAKNALIYYVLYPYGDITLSWRSIAASASTPATALASLMDATDTDRSANVVFEKVSFNDSPALRNEYNYTAGNGFDYTEVGNDKFGFAMTVVKGVNF